MGSRESITRESAGCKRRLRGPRVEKWAKELAAKRRLLRKLAPGCPEFNAAYRRAVKVSRTMDEYDGAHDEAARLVAPDLHAIGERIGKLLPRGREGRVDVAVEISVDNHLRGDKWLPFCSLCTTFQDWLPESITAATVPSVVAAALRKQAAILERTAARVERVKAKRGGKGVGA